MACVSSSAVSEGLGQPNPLDGEYGTPHPLHTAHQSQLFLWSFVHSHWVLTRQRFSSFWEIPLTHLQRTITTHWIEHGAPALLEEKVNKKKIRFAPRQDKKRAHVHGLGCDDGSSTTTEAEELCIRHWPSLHWPTLGPVPLRPSSH